MPPRCFSFLFSPGAPGGFPGTPGFEKGGVEKSEVSELTILMFFDFLSMVFLCMFNDLNIVLCKSLVAICTKILSS